MWRYSYCRIIHYTHKIDHPYKLNLHTYYGQLLMHKYVAVEPMYLSDHKDTPLYFHMLSNIKHHFWDYTIYLLLSQIGL